MTDLDRIEHALQDVLSKCRQRKIGSVPPDGQTVMEWFAAAIDEAKDNPNKLGTDTQPR